MYGHVLSYGSTRSKCNERTGTSTTQAASYPYKGIKSQSTKPNLLTSYENHMNKLFLIPALLLTLAFAGCSSSEPNGTFADMESSQTTSKKHAQDNADNFVMQGAMKGTFVMDKDSTITREYLRGDGFASGFRIVDGEATGQKIWCATVRGGGCKLTKPSQDGRADPNLDHSQALAK